MQKKKNMQKNIAVKLIWALTKFIFFIFTASLAETTNNKIIVILLLRRLFCQNIQLQCVFTKYIFISIQIFSNVLHFMKSRGNVSKHFNTSK